MSYGWRVFQPVKRTRAKAHGKTLQYVLEEQSDRAWLCKAGVAQMIVEAGYIQITEALLGYGKEFVFYSKGDGKPLVALKQTNEKR